MEEKDVLAAIEAAQKVLDEQNVPTEGRIMKFKYGDKLYEITPEEFNKLLEEINR